MGGSFEISRICDYWLGDRILSPSKWISLFARIGLSKVSLSFYIWQKVVVFNDKCVLL